MSRYAINIVWTILLFVSMGAMSLGKGRDLLPRGLYVAFDTTKPIYYLWREKTGTQYGVETILDFKRVLLTCTYGWGGMKRKNPLGKPLATSQNNGNYVSVGASYNFLKASQENNLAFLGFKYSFASFTDQLVGILQDESVVFWKDQSSGQGGLATKFVSQKNTFRANWWEIVTGVQAHVVGWIYAGCTADYKFAKNITIFDVHMPFDIMGWGFNEEEDAWGLHYYLSICIPLQGNVEAKG